MGSTVLMQSHPTALNARALLSRIGAGWRTHHGTVSLRFGSSNRRRHRTTYCKELAGYSRSTVAVSMVPELLAYPQKRHSKGAFVSDLLTRSKQEFVWHIYLKQWSHGVEKMGVVSFINTTKAMSPGLRRYSNALRLKTALLQHNVYLTYCL